MSERRRAVAALLGAALLWSTGGVLIKWVDWHPMAIMGTRSLIAAALTWALLRGRVRRIGRLELGRRLPMLSPWPCTSQRSS